MVWVCIGKTSQFAPLAASGNRPVYPARAEKGGLSAIQDPIPNRRSRSQHTHLHGQKTDVPGEDLNFPTHFHQPAARLDTSGQCDPTSKANAPCSCWTMCSARWMLTPRVTSCLLAALSGVLLSFEPKASKSPPNEESILEEVS